MKKIDNIDLNDINLRAEDLYVISDFDGTITGAESYGSLDVITYSQLLGDKYSEKHQYLVTEYAEKAKKSLDLTIKKELWFKHLSKYINLLKDYNLTKELLENIIKNSNIKFRKGFDKFIKYLYSKKIPLIIISSGLGNSIELFLKMNDMYYDNIYIVSNFVDFGQDGKIACIPKDIVTPVTKNEIFIDRNLNSIINKRKNKLVFGDIPDDICMSKINKHHTTLSIAFDNHKYINSLFDQFDVVTDNSNIFDLLEKLINEAK